MCSIEDLKLTTMDFCLGFFLFTCSIASPIANCGSGWTYGHHLSGTGCLRKLTSQFNQRSCLLNGYHLTLTNVPWGDVRRKDIYCVRDEHILHEEQTTTVADILDGIDNDDLKADMKSDIEAQSKEDIAKAMGCCLNGLQPSG